MSSAAAAGAAMLLAHKFGRTAATDGFLAAYGLYIVLALGAQAFRLVVAPDLTRAADEDRLGAELRAYSLSFAILALPTIVLVIAFRAPIADAMTGTAPAAHEAERALPFFVVAAFGQLLAALLASALAARGSYGAAALGFGGGAVARARRLRRVRRLVRSRGAGLGHHRQHRLHARGHGWAAAHGRRPRARSRGARRRPAALVARPGHRAPDRAPGHLRRRPAFRGGAGRRGADDALLRLRDRGHARRGDRLGARAHLLGAADPARAGRRAQSPCTSSTRPGSRSPRSSPPPGCSPSSAGRSSAPCWARHTRATSAASSAVSSSGSRRG